MYGRTPAFYFTFLIFTFFGILCSFSINFPMLCICLCFLGVGVGGNIPVDGSLFLEFLPAEKRYLLVFLTVFWSVSDSISRLLSYLLIPSNTCANANDCNPDNNRGWRYYLMVLSAISIFMLCFRFFFKIMETPRYLISRNRLQEGLDVLQTLADQNKSDMDLTLEDLESIHPPDTLESLWKKLEMQFTHILSIDLRVTTLLLWGIWLLLSMGTSMFFSFLPVFLKSSSSYNGHDLTLDETYRNYFITIACGIPGTLMASYCVDSVLGRRGVLFLACIGSAVSLYLFTYFTTWKGQLGSSCVLQFMANIV